MQKPITILTLNRQIADWLVYPMKTGAQRSCALVALTLLLTAPALASSEFTFPSDQPPEDLPIDRLVDIVEDGNRADVALPAEWADQLVARFPEWIIERYDEFSVNADLWWVEEFLDDLPADQAERILNNLKQHETSRVVRYGMLLDLRLNPSYDALLALIDLGFDADQIVDDLGGRQLNAILRGSLVSDQPRTAVRLFRKFSCQRLLEAGITRKRVRDLEPADSPVRMMLQERIDNIQCVYVSLDHDIEASNAQLDTLLNNLNETGTGFTSSPRPILPDDPNSDFRELPIRGGILIHDQCYENERLNEFGGMQSAVEEMIAKFANCQQDIRDWQRGGAAELMHIPEMLNVLDGGVDRLPTHYEDSNGATRPVQDACRDITSFEFFDDMEIENCQDLRADKKDKLKVFCQLDLYNVAKKEDKGYDLTSADTDSTAVGARHDMAFVRWRGGTKVYNGPYIGINPKRRVSRGELISTLGHEFIHTLIPHNTHHHSYPLNDFATMCEASCFYDDWAKDKISGLETKAAFHACNSLGTPDWDTRSTSQRIRGSL
jgi:hypothetical protein